MWWHLTQLLVTRHSRFKARDFIPAHHWACALHFSLNWSMHTAFYSPWLQNLSRICFAHAACTVIRPRFWPLVLVPRWIEVVSCCLAGCWSKLSLVETNCCSSLVRRWPPHHITRGSQHNFMLSWYPDFQDFTGSGLELQIIHWFSQSLRHY